MHDMTPRSKASGLATALAVLIALSFAAPTEADSPATLGESLRARQAGNTPVREMPLKASETEAGATQLAETWGIEISSIRLTANDHMIDYRYKVLDATKAASLFNRQIKPQLIHQETGRVLAVPDTAKVGPLRNSNVPQNDRIYWMFFGNAGHLVNAGDKVTVVIGDFVVEDLVVE